jgi:endonuclease YncB( thermonuclease family)
MNGAGIAARLRLHKDRLVRAAGFTAAAGAVGAALFAGSVLRDPARARPPAEAGAVQDGKDQTRVADDNRRAQPSHAESTDGALAHGIGGGDAQPEGDWREQDFAFVAVIDGRTLSAGDLTITLAGLELPQRDQVCRTLDDRLEPCTARAATQLELLTRSRRVACRYRMTTSSAGAGTCRVGAADLAERMVRTGYARAANGRAVMAKADGGEPRAP